MRRSIFLGLFILVTGSSFARIDSLVVRNKWCSRTDTIVLYKGGWNLLQAYGGGIMPEDIKFKSYDGDLKIGSSEIKKDTLSALAMPFETGKKFRIAVVEKRSGHVIRDLYCITDTLPEPVATIGFLKSNKVTKKDLLAQSLLRVAYPGSDYCYPYKILSYSFKAFKSPVSVTRQVEGTFIPIEVQKIIKDLAPGTAVLFSDIIAICPECNSRKLKDIKLLVQ